jgi:hypothetical protein
MKKPILTTVLFASVLTLHAAEADDGIYVRSPVTSARMIKAQDGSELGLGEQRTLEIRKAELSSQDNANTRFHLYLTVPYDANLDPSSYVLVVGGTGYQLSGSGSSQNESSSLSFYVSGDEKTKQVAKHFGIPLRYRQHPGHLFQIDFAPTKQEFEIGEDVTVNLRITNVGTNAVSFMKGGRNRAARDNQYVFNARYGGKQVEDIGTSYHFGGLAVKRVLKPGETFEDAISLKKWFSFESAGIYEVHGSYYLDFNDPVDASWKTIWEDYVSADFIVRVKAASNKRVEEAR